jgi:hypothetical protein
MAKVNRPASPQGPTSAKPDRAEYCADLFLCVGVTLDHPVGKRADLAVTGGSAGVSNSDNAAATIVTVRLMMRKLAMYILRSTWIQTRYWTDGSGESTLYSGNNVRIDRTSPAGVNLIF